MRSHSSSLQAPCDVLANTSIVTTIGSASTIMAEMIVLGITWRRTYRMHKESKALGFPTSFATLLLVDGTRAQFTSYSISSRMFSRYGLLSDPDTHPSGKRYEQLRRECNPPFCFTVAYNFACSCSQFSQLYIWYYFSDVYAPLPRPSSFRSSDTHISVSQRYFSHGSSSAFAPSTSMTQATASSRALASPSRGQAAVMEVVRAWPLSDPHLPS